MGMSAILCTLSPKRRALIEEDPSVLGELLAARHEGEVRGLLDLDKTWDALDRLLSRRASDAVLGDAVVARAGAKMRARADFGPARLLEKARVAEIAAALAALPDDVVAERYDELHGADEGDEGPRQRDRDPRPSVRRAARVLRRRGEGEARRHGDRRLTTACP